MRHLNIRAMIVTWSLLSILNLVCYADSRCSLTSYYNNCWIRRFPGLFIDIDQSQQRGAQLLEFYREESASKCSRACCLARNFSCNLAVYHYNTTQDSVNCFHLHCPTLQSCILRQRSNVILYNVTKGVDPDLLVFGKSFTSNGRVLPHQASFRLNVSEPFASDKRQFNRPQVAASSTDHPATCASTSHPSATATATSHASNLPLSVPSFIPVHPTQDAQDVLPISTTLKRSTQAILTGDIFGAPPHLATGASVKRTSIDPHGSSQASSIIFSAQTDTPSPPHFTSSATTAVPVTSSLPTSGSTTLSQGTSPGTWTPSTAYTTSETTSTIASVPTDLSTNINFNNKLTTTPIPLASTQVKPTAISAPATLDTTYTTLASHLPTTVKSLTPYMTTTAQPQVNQKSFTITTWPQAEKTNRPSSIFPLTEDDISQFPTDGQPKVLITSTTTEDSTGSATPTPLTRSHLPASVTNNGLNTSLTSHSSMEDSQPHPNDTKGYISRNVTTGGGPRPGADEDSKPAWYLAANTILVVLATCGTVAFGCCCSVLMAVSWRGRRRRKGRYQTTLRGKRASMQLIKYVIVREGFPKTGSVL